MEYHDGHIQHLEPNEIFVFGSNLAGIHGAGAARQAHRQFGAQWGVGLGPTGRCFALPTKDTAIRTLAVVHIGTFAQVFINHAKWHSQQRFLLTAVGCGLAGYSPEVIAPLFATAPENVIMPPEFKECLSCVST